MTAMLYMPDQVNLVDKQTCAVCPVCPVLAEAMAVIEETVEALETGHHTIHTIARARRFLVAHSELR
jgi:hypothetical protein